MDCNSFYASCERVFRPELNGRPVIVLSNNDGCAIARTNEAKALGIKMGAPYFEIKDLCKKHNVAVFSSNFALYTNMSDRVMGVLEKNCPRIQVYSVDEAFLDLTGVPDLTEFGRYLRKIVHEHIGIPTGFGIAPTKVLSKIANHIAKKSKKAGGVVNLMDPKLQDVALKRTKVEDIWGVGARSAEKLNGMGLYTAYDFKEYANERLIQKIFTKVGLQIKHELMGINCFDLEMDVEKKKEIMCSRSFNATIYTKQELAEIMSGYIEKASEKMRSQDSTCLEVSVFARTNPFKNTEQYYMFERAKLINPTCDTRKLIRIALRLLDQGFREGYEYKKAGVRLSRFYDSIEYQIDFFHPSDSEKDQELMKVVDGINFREGEGAIKFASSGTTDQGWRMNRNHKSPRYTTNWNELPKF